MKKIISEAPRSNDPGENKKNHKQALIELLTMCGKRHRFIPKLVSKSQLHN